MADGSSKTAPKPLGKTKRRKKPLKEGFGSFLTYFLFMCASGGGTIAMLFGFVQIWDDLRLHFTGTLAKESSCYINFLITKHEYRDISVYYTTQTGAKHRQHLDAFSFWGPNRKKTCVVRYDPASPTHVTTSWGFEMIFSRTLLLIFGCAAGAGGTFAMGNALVLGIGRRLGWVRPPAEGSSQAADGTAPKPNEGSGVTRKPAAVPLRDKAAELSRALHKLAAVLESNHGAEAAYAKAMGSRIDALAKDYDQAIFITHSRDHAADIIATVTEELGEVIAAYRRPKRHLGFRYVLARRQFRRLNTIFRESRYAGDVL